MSQYINPDGSWPYIFYDYNVCPLNSCIHVHFLIYEGGSTSPCNHLLSLHVGAFIIIIITRHDCALCKGASQVRRKHLFKWRNHFSSLVVLQTKTCSRKNILCYVWPLLTFDLYWGHDCPQFDSLVLLTKFESHMAWLTIWPLMIFGWPSWRSSSFLTCSGTSDQMW